MEVTMEKYGFIYLWYDKKHKRYYIGSHWGTEDDGYISSSTWMKNAYKRRPHDFKRRILKTNVSRETLLDEEYNWLSKIKEKELGKKYYNLNIRNQKQWWSTEEGRKNVGQKLSVANKGKKRTDEFKKKISDITKGREPWNKGKSGYKIPSLNGNIPWNKGKKGLQTSPMKGKKLTEEQKLKISLAKKGVKHKKKRVYKQ
jgi:hypothetical protein